MKKILLSGILLLWASAAFGACPNTVSVKDASGSTVVYCVNTDGGTNKIGAFSLYDSAGANVAGVNASGQLAIQAPPSLPALSAGSANIGGVELFDSGGTNKASISAAGALKVDGSAVTQPVSGTVTANAGTGTFGTNLAQVGGASVALGQTTKSASIPVTQASDYTPPAASLATNGGWTPGVASALSNTATAIKASAGELGNMICGNTNAAMVYVQIYNVAAASVTVGTTTASYIIPVAANSTASAGLDSGFSGMPGGHGMAFGTAISFAATTTATGSTAPGSALTCSYTYN